MRTLFFVGLAVWGYWPAFARADCLNEFRDAQFLALYESAAVRSVRDFAQLPLWNPYYCGGIYAYGFPQSRFAVPTFALSVWLGAERATVAVAVLLTVLGMEGMFRFLRLRGVVSWVALLCSPIFPLNGYFVASYFNGWVISYGLQLLPWVLYAQVQLIRGGLSAKYVGVFAGAFAFMIGFGGTYSVPQAALCCVAYEAVELSTRCGRWGAKLSALAKRNVVLFAASVGASAFRLLPIADVMRTSPRTMEGNPFNSPTLLANMYLAPAGPENGEFLHNGLLFVGVAAAIALAAALLVALWFRRKRTLALMTAGGLFFWLGLGYVVPLSAFAALRALPIFNTLRYPERFSLPLVVFAVELTAAVFTACFALRRTSSSLRAQAGSGLVVLFTGLLVWANVALAGNAQTVMRAMWMSCSTAVRSGDFVETRGNRWLAAHYVDLNAGSLVCAEGFPVAMSSELSPTGDFVRSGPATTRFWSPNRIELEVREGTERSIVLNQNWHAGWRGRNGRVFSSNGLLAIEIEPAAREIELYFLPSSFVWGVALSLMSMVTLLCLHYGVRRRQSEKGPSVAT